MNTKIISSIYFDLYGTELGGRPGRNDHYLYSMNSIMNINNAKFIIYTNNKNKIDNFFMNNFPDKLEKYISIEYDLYNTEYKDKINLIKNIESTKKSDRCIELQYSKLSWLKMNATDCENIYWIDAGLCHSGIIPDKYLKIGNNYYDSYYGSEIFTSELLDNLNKNCKEKMFVCAKDNSDYYWDSPVPSSYFSKAQPQSHYHIIGGLFGGNLNIVNYICEQFNFLANKLLDHEKHLYSEEQILSCLFFTYPELFIYETFDIWWHENNIMGVLDKESAINLLNKAKSFYRIIEKFK